MSTETFYLNRKPFIGETATLDHCVQEFVVVIRSCSGVSPEQLQNLIQQKHEVVQIEQNNARNYLRVENLEYPFGHPSA